MKVTAVALVASFFQVTINLKHWRHVFVCCSKMSVTLSSLTEHLQQKDNDNTMVIIMTLKRALVLTMFSVPRNCLKYILSSGEGAIMCKSRATQRALITCNTSCAT